MSLSGHEPPWFVAAPLFVPVALVGWFLLFKGPEIADQMLAAKAYEMREQAAYRLEGASCESD